MFCVYAVTCNQLFGGLSYRVSGVFRPFGSTFYCTVVLTACVQRQQREGAGFRFTITQSLSRVE